jgi:glycosyltransferase involved in cell wall biosynthesis
MAAFQKGRATICVVNYKTLDLTRLCLRSIRKFTTYPYEVIVIDNDSADESLEYLKGLKWIRLIERASKDDPEGGYSHGAGLDLGLANCSTEFFVSMHSDTLVRKERWLEDLIAFFDKEDVACVGAGKLELEPQWRTLIKKMTDIRTLKRKVLREPDPEGRYRYYNRTICAFYRTQILKKLGLSFLGSREKGLTVGKKLYFELVDRGYKAVELSPGLMSGYVTHLAHATQMINPGQCQVDGRAARKYTSTMKKLASDGLMQRIMSDKSLDE